MLRGASLNLGLALTGVMVFMTLGLPRGTPGWPLFSGFTPAVLTLAVCGWGCDRVWNAAVAPLIGSSHRWPVYLTRLPFWYMAGGMGITLGILIAKKYSLLDLYEIPVKPYFTEGARIYIAVQITVSLLIEVVLRRRSGWTSAG